MAGAGAGSSGQTGSPGFVGNRTETEGQTWRGLPGRRGTRAGAQSVTERGTSVSTPEPGVTDVWLSSSFQFLNTYHAP